MRKFLPAIPAMASFAGVRLVLQNALSDITDRWLQWVNAPSFGGNRVTSVADPVDASDAATKGYVDRVAAQSAPPVTMRTQTQYPASYAVNMAKSTQAALAALALTLGTSDTGLRVEVTDYAHVLRWTGSAWEWAPEDDHRAGEITHFDAAPGTGWKLIDGLGDDGGAIGVSHPITILKSDGTTRTNTTAASQTASVHLRGAAAYNGAVTAATVPTFAGAAMAAHQHATVDLLSGSVRYWNSTAPFGTVAVTNAPGQFISGGASGLASASYGMAATESVSAGTPSGTIALPEDPVAFTSALPYIRK